MTLLIGNRRNCKAGAKALNAVGGFLERGSHSSCERADFRPARRIEGFSHFCAGDSSRLTAAGMANRGLSRKRTVAKRGRSVRELSVRLHGNGTGYRGSNRGVKRMLTGCRSLGSGGQGLGVSRLLSIWEYCLLNNWSNTMKTTLFALGLVASSAATASFFIDWSAEDARRDRTAVRYAEAVKVCRALPKAETEACIKRLDADIAKAEQARTLRRI